MENEFPQYKPGFSWIHAKQAAVETAIADNKCMAILGTNPEFKDKHSDWCRDAGRSQPNFAQLIKETREKVLKEQQLYETRKERRK